MTKSEKTIFTKKKKKTNELYSLYSIYLLVVFLSQTIIMIIPKNKTRIFPLGVKILHKDLICIFNPSNKRYKLVKKKKKLNTSLWWHCIAKIIIIVKTNGSTIPLFSHYCILLYLKGSKARVYMNICVWVFVFLSLSK